MKNTQKNNAINHSDLTHTIVIKKSIGKLSCIETLLQVDAALINDHTRSGARLILNDVIESLEQLQPQEVSA